MQVNIPYTEYLGMDDGKLLLKTFGCILVFIARDSEA